MEDGSDGWGGSPSAGIRRIRAAVRRCPLEDPVRTLVISLRATSTSLRGCMGARMRSCSLATAVMVWLAPVRSLG
jgi:hypothetical protein